MITKTGNDIKLIFIVFLTTILAACGSLTLNPAKPAATLTQTTNMVLPTASPSLSVTLTAFPATLSLDPEYVVVNSIKIALRTDNPHAPRVVAITGDEKCDIRVSWTIVGTSTDLNVNANNVRDDATRIIRAIAQNDSDFNFTCVVLEAYWPTSETTDKLVVKLIYKKSTVDRINWNTFTTGDIYLIADSSFVDSVLQGE